MNRKLPANRSSRILSHQDSKSIIALAKARFVYDSNRTIKTTHRPKKNNPLIQKRLRSLSEAKPLPPTNISKSNNNIRFRRPSKSTRQNVGLDSRQSASRQNTRQPTQALKSLLESTRMEEFQTLDRIEESSVKILPQKYLLPRPQTSFACRPPIDKQNRISEGEQQAAFRKKKIFQCKLIKCPFPMPGLRVAKKEKVVSNLDSFIDNTDGISEILPAGDPPESLVSLESHQLINF